LHLERRPTRTRRTLGASTSSGGQDEGGARARPCRSPSPPPPQTARFLELALQCVDDIPSKRPNMVQVVATLRELDGVHGTDLGMTIEMDTLQRRLSMAFQTLATSRIELQEQNRCLELRNYVRCYLSARSVLVWMIYNKGSTTQHACTMDIGCHSTNLSVSSTNLFLYQTEHK
jgi:hypothetical protein